MVVSAHGFVGFTPYESECTSSRRHARSREEREERRDVDEGDDRDHGHEELFPKTLAIEMRQERQVIPATTLARSDRVP